MDEQQRIETKMQELVAKWKDKPIPVLNSREWFLRRGDRLLYRILLAKLKKLVGEEKEIESPDALFVYTQKLFST